MWTRRFLLVSLTLALGAACGDDTRTGATDAGSDAGPPPAGDYASVAQVFSTGCALSASCHGGAGPGAAGLNLQAARDGETTYDALLVDVASCQYPPMPLVDPGNPDNSWLYVKMTGPHEGARITFEPEAGFTPPSGCGTTGAAPFGTLMPQGLSSPDPRAAIVRAWIENGAPGPE